MGVALCILAFALAVMASRRSVAGGLSTVISIGYFYGILRANFPEAASHFIFDSAVLGFYLALLFRRQSLEIRVRSRGVFLWLIALVALPAIVALIPMQDPLVQLVGLRGAIFLLPFLLFGARLTEEEVLRVTMVLAVLNLIAFTAAAVEFRVGIEAFYPHNNNTDLIYRSADVGSSDQYRIPAIFTGSHAYAGAMVMSLPFLIGAWTLAGVGRRQKVLLFCAIIASILGVFAAASRVHTIVLAIVVLSTLLSGRIRMPTRVLMLGLVGIIAIVVVAEKRLQRFTTLQDSEMVSSRVAGSVNTTFFELLLEYPFGNGLGGGGTSIPYFLEDRIHNRVVLENEYARIVLEQTVIGLGLWIAFIGWFMFRRFTRSASHWGLGQQLGWIACVAYFGTGMIGTGLLTSIPQTVLMLFCMGWVSADRTVPVVIYEEEVLLENAAT